MKIWLRIDRHGRHSWTIVWNHLRKALLGLGHDVPHDPFVFPKEWVNCKVVEMWWCDPQYWEWSKRSEVKFKVGYAISEARSILNRGRENVIYNISQCDVLLCPSEHATRAFKETRIMDTVPIRVVPLGVDPDQCFYVKRDFGNTLRFLLLGATQFRKGSWLAPEAFVTAFKKRDKVSLTIACFAGEIPMFAQLKNEYGNYPNIHFVTHMEESPMEYYKRHDVLVSPHLAEGYGLCIPEAGATGMPCIVARCSAPLEFFSREFGWWIEMSEDYAPVSRCLVNTGGYWRVPSGDNLAEKMAYAYNHRQECEQKGKAASDYILHTMTWSHTAANIVKAIEKHSADVKGSSRQK